MKNQLMFAVLASALFLTPACQTIDKEQTAKDAAIILKGSTRSATILALENHPEKARQYINLTVEALDSFILQQDKSPTAFRRALEPVVKEASEPEIQIAVNTVLDLYEIFYGRHIKADFPADHPYIMLFLRNIRAGAAEALDQVALRQTGA